MKKLGRILAPVAVVGLITALTPVASADDMASPLTVSSERCGFQIHYVEVGGTPVVRFAGEVGVDECLPPMYFE